MSIITFVYSGLLTMSIMRTVAARLGADLRIDIDTGRLPMARGGEVIGSPETLALSTTAPM